ncbi:transposable element Tcb1 transposase [Trichonephila clavipes]|nr:transposable element Tcb1 transposase [Trichonephila clavipes]
MGFGRRLFIVTKSGSQIVSFSCGAIEDPPCVGLMYDKSVVALSVLFCVVWKFEERGAAPWPSPRELCLVENRSAFDQVSECDRGRIVVYRDYGLSFRKIGSRVGRNQTTVMRICDRWMQEGTTDRHGRSHPLHVRTEKLVTDRSVTSRTIAQHIESVTHH